MFSKKLMSRKMFQEGGMVTPSMPAPSGGIVEGLGLNAPAMPPIPPQDQAALTEGLADMAGKIGQVDAAEDTASLINAIRSDNQSLDDRYTELARYVGRDDATKTPESVLTLVQPTFEMLEQGGGLGMLGSDILQGDAPMEDMMTTTMTETTEAPTLFNQGGLAVKKPQTPVKRQSGSPLTGEIANPYDITSFYAQREQNPLFQLSRTNPYRFGSAMDSVTGRAPDPLARFGANPVLGSTGFFDPYQDMRDRGGPETARRRQMMNAQMASRQGILDARQAGIPNPSAQLAADVAEVRAGLPQDIATATARLQNQFGTITPRSAEELMTEYMGVAEGADIVPSVTSADDYRAQLDALLAPSREPDKTAEEILAERQEFLGDMDRGPEALFALAQAFNTVANTPGTLLQGLAAGSGQAAELLAPIAREQEILDRQMRGAALDEFNALQQRLREDDRSLALSAFQMFRDDEASEAAFKQSVFAQALSQEAAEATTAQEHATQIKELALEAGVELNQAEIDALVDAYEPLRETRTDGVGRIYGKKLMPNGTIQEVYVGRVGEDGKQYFNRKHALRADNPLVIPEDPEGVPEQNFATLAEEQVKGLDRRIAGYNRALDKFEQIFRNAQDEDGNFIAEKMGTGPASMLKSIATNSLGAFGADWATWIGNRRNQTLLLEAVREFIQATALNDRFAVAEQEIIKQMVDLPVEFFNNPEVAWHRTRDIITELLNKNEADHAIIEGRPAARIVNLGSGTRNDPIPYSNPNFRSLLQLASEQGRSWNGHVRMTPDEAMLSDPRMNPNGLTDVKDLRKEYEDPNVAASRPRIDKYEEFRRNNNPIDIYLEISPEQKGEFFTFEPIDPRANPSDASFRGFAFNMPPAASPLGRVASGFGGQ